MSFASPMRMTETAGEKGLKGTSSRPAASNHEGWVNRLQPDEASFEKKPRLVDWKRKTAKIVFTCG